MKQIISRNRLISLILSLSASCLLFALYLLSNNIVFGGVSLGDFKLIFMIFSIVSLCFWTGAIIISMLLKTEEKIIDELNQTINLSDEEVAKEYRTADRNGILLVNNHCTFIKKGFSVRIIPNYNIVWVYKKQSFKGSSRALQHSLVINTIKRKTYDIPFHKTEELNKFIQKYSNFQHIILGYDNKIHGLFKHNLKDFLELQYNDNKPRKIPDIKY